MSRRSTTAPRRGRRVEPASDEEDGQSRIDEENEDEERPRRSAKNRKRSTVAPEAPLDEDDDDDIPEIDVNKFTDQPLERTAAMKLNNVLQDWKSAEEKLNNGAGNNPFNVVVGAAEAVAEYGEDQAEPILDQLDKVMRELIDASVEMKLHQTVLEGLRQRIQQGDEIDDVLDQWEKGVKAMRTDYIKKTPRQKYSKDERYQRFKENVWNVQHEEDGKAMPPLSSFIAKEDGDEDDSDDEVEVGGVTQDFKDPLTMTIMSDPVTSRICKHSYSKASIMEYLQHGPKKCPATGCNKQISKADMFSDADLSRRVNAFKRRQQRRDEDESQQEDDDDIVD